MIVPKFVRKCAKKFVRVMSRKISLSDSSANTTTTSAANQSLIPFGKNLRSSLGKMVAQNRLGHEVRHWCSEFCLD